MDGATLSTRDFTPENILGLRVALSTSLPGGTRFCLQLELVSGEGRCTRHYYLGVSANAVLLSLFSYQTDMMQMLGAVDDQDAFLRVSVERTGRCCASRFVDTTERRSVRTPRRSG